MNWTDKEEEFLMKVSFQSNLYYQYYNKEYINYNNLSRQYNIPILIISAINSLMAISLSQFMPQNIVSIMNAILSATTGILGSIQLFLKINEKMTNCLMASVDFNHLYLKITKELSIERELRASDGKTFLNEAFNEFNQIIDKAIPLDKKVDNLIILEEFHKLKLSKSKSHFSLSLPSPKNSNYSTDNTTNNDENSSIISSNSKDDNNYVV
jgi:hypothetical protein